jgi:hypothetical protein
MKQLANILSNPAAGASEPSGGSVVHRLGQAVPVHPRQWLGRLGTPGIAAIGLLIACAGFYMSVLMPLDAEIDDLTERVSLLSWEVERATLGGQQGTPALADQMAAFYKLFPGQGQLTDAVAKVFDAAAVHGIALQQGEYRIAEDQAGALKRFQITLPVTADYPRIRRFLATVVAEVPTAALEHIQFERRKIGDPQVEATIKLAIYMEQGS